MVVDMSEQQDRTVVRTYVPQYQQEEWAEAAESMDMSLSEFVRSMVQAGQRDFDLDGDASVRSFTPEKPLPADATPGGQPLEDRVLETLDSGNVRTWDELVGELSGDFETRLQESLDALMESGKIRMDHRRGGYRLRGDE